MKIILFIKRVKLSIFLIMLSVTLLIVTMAGTKRTYRKVYSTPAGVEISYTLEKLTSIPDEIVYLPKVEKLTINLLGAIINSIYINNNSEYIDNWLDLLDMSAPSKTRGIRITILSVYYDNASNDIKVLCKVLVTSNKLQELYYYGCPGNDLVKDKSTGNMSFIATLFAGDNLFIGNNDSQNETVYYVYGFTGDDCFMGGYKNDTLSSGSGSDILWGRGGINDLLNSGPEENPFPELIDGIRGDVVRQD